MSNNLGLSAGLAVESSFKAATASYKSFFAASSATGLLNLPILSKNLTSSYAVFSGNAAAIKPLRPSSDPVGIALSCYIQSKTDFGSGLNAFSETNLTINN